MSPNWEAFAQAVGVMIVATPFMFGVLTIFSLLILAVGRIPGGGKENA